MMNCEKKVFLLSTQYSLLIYLLIEKDWKKTYFLGINSRIKKSFIDNLYKCGANHIYGRYIDAIKTRDIKNSGVRVFVKLLRAMVLLYLLFIKKLIFKKNNTKVFGLDHAYLAKFFYDYHFTAIEDGLANYYTEEETVNWCKKHQKGLLKSIVPFGFSSKIDEVYLTGRKEILDSKMKKKAKIFNMEECWKSKTEIEKKEILFVFGYDVDTIKDLIEEGRNIFLLTQDFSCRYCTELEQVEMYRLIMKDVNLSNVVIKTHPGDKIEYEKYFPQCKILRDDFPFELIYLTKIPVKKIITVNSTSAYGLWPEEIIETHEDIAINYWQLTKKEDTCREK